MTKTTLLLAGALLTSSMAFAHYHNYYPSQPKAEKKYFSRHDRKFGCLGEKTVLKGKEEVRYAVKFTGVIDTNSRNLSGEPVKIKVGTVVYDEEKQTDVYTWNFKRQYNLPSHSIWLDASDNLISLRLDARDARRNSMRLYFGGENSTRNLMRVQEKGHTMEVTDVNCKLLSNSPW